MKAREFFELLRKGVRELYENPLIIVPSLVLWAVLFGISKAGGSIAYNLATTASNVGWSTLVSLVVLLLVSFMLSGTIGIIKKKNKKEFFKNAKKFVWRNFFVILIITIVSIVVFWLSFGLAYGIGRGLGLEAQSAAFVFALLYFIGLIGVSIFFTFASFCLVIEDMKVGASLRKSFRLVKREYLATLSLLVILFVVGYLLNLIPDLYGEIAIYVLFVPFVVSVLTKFVLGFGKKI